MNRLPGDAALAETQGARRSVRLPAQLPLFWTRHGLRQEVMGADISLHGLFFRTSEKPTLGSMLQLEVPMPSGLITMFVVARYVGNTVSGHGVGVEIFVCEKISEWRRYYLSQLARHQPKPQVMASAIAR